MCVCVFLCVSIHISAVISVAVTPHCSVYGSMTKKTRLCQPRDLGPGYLTLSVTVFFKGLINAR